MGESRHKRDYEDYVIFRDWLEQRNPFTFVDEHLHSLTSGWVSVSAEHLVLSEIRADLSNHSKSIGWSKFINWNWNAKCIRPLEVLGNVVKIDKEQVHVNPIILFTRLTAITEREDDVKKYFSLEMMPYPPSLFKDGLMRRADKAALRRALMSGDEAVGKDQIDDNSYVTEADGWKTQHSMHWLNSIYLTLEDKLLMLFLMDINMLPRSQMSRFDELMIKSAQILKWLLSILYQLHKIIFFQMNTTKLNFLKNTLLL